MRKTIRHSNDRCYGCPLSRDRNHNTTYVPTEIEYSDVQPDGRPKVDVLFVSEPPSMSSDLSGSPLAGDASRDVAASLAASGVTSYAVTNCMKCRSVDSDNKLRTYSVEEIAACRNYLLKDIEYLDPKVVILAGTLPVQMLGSNPEWRNKTAHFLKGRSFTPDDGPTQLVTINPGLYLRKEDAVERRRFFRNIRSVQSLMNGEETKWSRRGEVKLITGLGEFNDLIGYLRHDCTNPLAFDTETFGLNRVAKNALATIQFSSEMDLAYVVPVDHWDTPFTEKKQRTYIKRELNSLFRDPDSNFPFWIAHNSPFDSNIVRRSLKVRSQPAKKIVCTQFLAYLQDENQAEGGSGIFNAFRLKDMSRELLGFRGYDTYLSDAIAARSGANGGSLWDLSLDALSVYGGTDAYITYRLFKYYHRWLNSQNYKGALKFAHRWHGRASYVFMRMSANGFPLDTAQLEYLKSDSSPILGRLKELPKEIYATKEAKEANRVLLSSDKRTKGMTPLFGKVPWALDINKKSHRVHLFIDSCRLMPLSYGKDGTPGINKEFFDHYSNHSLVSLYKEYSGLFKLSTSYLNSVSSLLVRPDNAIDSRIRASFHLLRTVTGRVSCLPGGTPISTSRGILKIEEVVDGDLVQTHKGPAEVSSSFYSGEEEVLRFHLESGRSLECTGNHKVFVNGRWTYAKDIVVGDDLYHCSVEGPDVPALCPLDPLPSLVGRANTPSLPPLLTDRVAFLLGHFVADGCVGYNDLRPALSSSDRKGKVPVRAIIALGGEGHSLRKFLVSEWKEIFGLDFIYDDRKAPLLDISSVDLCRWLILNGFSSKSRDAIVPECVLRSPVSVRKAFLRGLFAGDGGSTDGDTALSTESLSLATSVHTLLTSLGVDCSLYHQKRPGRDSTKRIVRVSGGSRVGWIFWSNRKRDSQTSSPRGLGVRKPPWFDGSVLWDTIRSYYGFNIVPKSTKSATYTQLHRFVTRPNARATALVSSRTLPAITEDDTAEASFMRFSADSGARSLSVKRIERAGVQKVYDLTVPSTGAFLVNGILCHNSSDPNLQQLPKGAPHTAKAAIRSLYGASPGHMLVECDYKQAEVRWWAQISRDLEYAKLFTEMKEMRDEYRRTGDEDLGRRVDLECDIHKKVASIMFKIATSDVSSDVRKKSKALCVKRGTLVRTDLGLEKIEDVVSRFDGTALPLETRNGSECVSKVWSLTVPRTLTLNTSRGYTLGGRPEHRVLVWKDMRLTWAELQDIREGDGVVVRRSAHLWPTQQVPLTPYVWKRKTGSPGAVPGLCKFPKVLTGDIARLAGYLTAEGDCTDDTHIQFSNKSPAVIEDFERILKSNFVSGYSRCVDHNSGCTVVTLNLRISRFLRNNLLADIANSHTKGIPLAILRCPKSVAAEYVRGYWAGAGSMGKKCSVTTASEKLAKGLHLLLLDLGIVSTCSSSHRVTSVGEGTYWDVRCMGRDAGFFMSTLPPIREGSYKKPAWFSSNIDNIPGLMATCSAFRKDNPYAKAGSADYSGQRTYPSLPWTGAKEMSVHFAQTHKEELLRGLEARDSLLARDVNEILSEGFYIDRVSSIVVDDSPDQEVFDFTVPGSHSFVSQGFISHNCFGSIFGQHYKTLANILQISPDAAVELQNTFIQEFSKAGNWLTEIERTAQRTGIVSTPMGRVRHLSDMYKKDEGAGDRRARNSPIQAASSDTTVLAAWRLQHVIDREKLPFKIINCVHDAITLEIPIDYVLLKLSVDMLEDAMANIDTFLKDEFGVDMIVPMEIDFDLGVRWGHLLTYSGVERDLAPIFDKCVEWDSRLSSGEKWHDISSEEFPPPSD